MPRFDGTSDKNADISILSNFLAIFFSNLISVSRNFTNYHLRVKFQINWTIQTEITWGGGGGQNLSSKAIPICKKPGLFRVKRQVKTLQVQTEDQQQYSRRICIMIHGIPENESEDTDKLIMDVFTVRLDVIFGIQDIDRSHRPGPSARVLASHTDQDTVKVRPFIVKFVSYRVRQLFMKSRRNLKSSKMFITGFLIKSKQSLLKELHQKVGLKMHVLQMARFFSKRSDNFIKINESSDIGVKLYVE